MTQMPPMTDYEKQQIMDIENEARQMANEFNNIQIVEMNNYEDPFTYTKNLLMAICKATGQQPPTDDEIREIIEKARDQVNRKFN